MTGLSPLKGKVPATNIFFILWNPSVKMSFFSKSFQTPPENVRLMRISIRLMIVRNLGRQI